MPGAHPFDWAVLAVAAAVWWAFASNRLVWRDRRLNRHPGLYLRAWGKWYRVLRDPLNVSK